MVKKFIEVFDVGTKIVFLHENALLKGQINNFKLYNSTTLNYDIMYLPALSAIEVIAKNIDSSCVFESKEAYIEYIKKLEV
jgi:hypothetical protein